MPFVVDRFGKIARGHFGKLRLGEILQMNLGTDENQMEE
jgi:hypothetical protein